MNEGMPGFLQKIHNASISNHPNSIFLFKLYGRKCDKQNYTNNNANHKIMQVYLNEQFSWLDIKSDNL